MRYVHAVDDVKRQAVSTLEKGGRNNALAKSWSNGKSKAS
jgi:hypothetical protein